MTSVITNSQGEKIDYEYLEEDSRFSDWIVLLGHGVTGNRNRPVIADTAKALNQAGFSTLAFSFSGNGDSEGDFKDSCVSKGVKDLGTVLNAVEDKKIVYIAHSMGAAIGVLTAAKNNKIQRMVSLAGMVNTKQFAQNKSQSSYSSSAPNVPFAHAMTRRQKPTPATSGQTACAQA